MANLKPWYQVVTRADEAKSRLKELGLGEDLALK